MPVVVDHVHTLGPTTEVLFIWAHRPSQFCPGKRCFSGLRKERRISYHLPRLLGDVGAWHYNREEENSLFFSENVTNETVKERYLSFLYLCYKPNYQFDPYNIM